MKLHKQILCVGVLCLCFSLTGCGLSLTSLTDKEEEQVVLYAAKIVSKYNRSQDKGYVYVSKAKKKQEKKEKDTTEKTSEQSKEEEMTLNDAIAAEGVTFTYQGYDVSDTFSTQDVAVPNADAGHKYLILKIQAANTSDKDLSVDLLTQSLNYKISINGDVTADGVSTLSREDLSTYYNTSFAAGTTDDLVLLFSVQEDALKNISDLTLQVTRDGKEYNRKL